jgi:hypothetical protein
MDYFCYAYEQEGQTPHMEAVGDDLAAATAQAERMLKERPRCIFSEVWQGDTFVTRIDRTSGTSNLG